MSPQDKKIQPRLKEQKYRGLSLEELQVMDVRELSKHLPSTPRRYILRNFEKIEKFLKTCDEKANKNKKIKTHLRDILIVPKLVGKTIAVHNGRAFNDVVITVEMIGHKLGEFSPTRGKVNHGSAGIGATKSSKSQKK